MLDNVRKDKATALDVTGSTISVLVGPKRKPFSVHEALVRSGSAFFEAALSKEWREKTERCVKLPDDDPDVFELYVLWLYTGTICSKGIISPGKGLAFEYESIAKLYTLGEKLQDKTVQNAVMNCFREVAKDTNKYPSSNAINTIYSGIMQGSPARQLMVDMYVWNAGPNLGIPESLPNTDFLLDVTRALINQRPRPSKGLLGATDNPVARTPSEMCFYHSHEEGQKCSSGKREAGAVSTDPDKRDTAASTSG